MNVSDLIDPSFSYRLIATLMHLLWQGCLVALVTIPADWLLRHAPASRRYVLHVTALTVMVACVAVTFLQIESPVSEPAMSDESAPIMPITDMISPNPGDVDPTDLPRSLPPSFVGVEATLPELPADSVSPEPVVQQNVREENPIVNGDGWREFKRWAPQIALYYFACCALLLARLARGTWSAHRLRRTATPVSDDSIIAMLHRQSKQLGLRVIPRVAWCAEVSIPLVIGIFKPMILLPAAAVTGLSPDQLQALITHELAHIYRYDLLVNLLQRIVESLLFFHPVVWYISRRISSEREHACDEMVLATGCERLRYADALVRMAELSTLMHHPGQSAPATSLAATGANSSEFKRRVLKVLSVPTTSQLRPSRVALLVVLTLILGAALFASRRHFSAHADTPTAPAETETAPQDGLEFLKPYPMLRGLSLDMTQSQFLEIIKQQDLKSRTSVEAGKVTYHLALGDDHMLIVMFDKDGKCKGIQRVRGEDDVANEPASVLAKPQAKEALWLFQKWQQTARANGDIPGGTIGPLVRVMKNFVKNNPTHEGSPKFTELLKRIDVTRDWSRDEAVKLLDEVTAIYPSLPEWVEDKPRFTLGGEVVVGKPLPDDLKDAPWGEAQPNGLRAAWLLEPRGNEHRRNTALKSRVLIHNSGKNAVVFRALTWNQSGAHKAHDAQGQEISIFSTWWTTIPRTFVCRLAPGEFIEVIGAGIGVGQNKDDEDWRDARSEVRVGSWIEAKVGDDVTFIPAAIDGDGRESARPDDDDTPATPNSWWLKFIKDRLSLDAPLPADANERGLLLERAVRDLFGNAPTNEEVAEFKNDTNPGAFDALAKRLAERSGFETFSGMLTSGPTKFKVLPVDPDAAKKPRTAKGPGQYPLGGNTAFVVTRRPIGERIVNEARLDFAPTDATKPAPRESHPVPLPDGYDTWIAAWLRGGTVLWIAQTDTEQKTSIRRYDYTNPGSVLETVITDLKPGTTFPHAILEVQKAFFQRARGEDNNGAGRVPKPDKHSAQHFTRNGLRYELEAVGFASLDQPGGAERKDNVWWRADGTNVDATPANLAEITVPKDQANFREFVLRAHVVDEQEIRRHTAGEFWVPPSSSQRFHTSRLAGQDVLRFQLVKKIEVEKPASFALYFTDAPWSVSATLDLNGQLHPNTEMDDKYLSLVKQFEVTIVEKLPTTTIVKAHPTSDESRRTLVTLSAIKLDGQMTRAIDPTTDELYVINTPLSEIEAFQISLRRMTHKATFENVATLPGQKTEPTVSLEPLDTLLRVTLRKDGQTLGILSDMSVTQLEETLPVLQHDLNSATSELIIDTQLVTTFTEVEGIVKRLKASGWKWPAIAVKSPKSSDELTPQSVSPEFLKPYPKLNGLSLSMTETQFLEIVAKHGIKTARNVDGVAGRYHVSTGDEHTLIVAFDKDGNCIGIQRVRGEEKRHAMEVRLVGGPKNEPLSKLNVEFTSGHGSDRKSFGTFTTDDAGWIRTTLPVGFYYLHLSSEQERPYLAFEKFWTGDGQGLSRSLNVRVTETEVEKWLDGKRRESGFEAATKDRPARITFTLEPAIELVLRAIDLETGKGISGVEFYEEVAAGEDWAHPIYAENIGTKFTYHTVATKEQKNLTDKEGYLRRWISDQTDETKFGAWKMPGYELIEPKGEISLPVNLGQKRVEQNFRFRRVREAKSEASKKP